MFFILHNYINNVKIPPSVCPAGYHFTEMVTVKILVYDTRMVY